MLFRETALPGAYLVDIDKHVDERGFFARTWCQREALSHGIDDEFVQNSVSFNPVRGTLRGLHYQRAPHEEAKIVQCTTGAIYDVIVDLRSNSPTFGRWLGVELTAESYRMLYIPRNFAHGFQTLRPDTHVSYMVSAFFTSDAACGIRYDDESLGIEWPLPITRISPRDKSWPTIEGRLDVLASAATRGGR